MYDHLVQMGSAVPVPGNKAGSYLTAFSLQGFYTDITGIIAGFVQIFVDQSYWQSAVAASPTQAVKVSLVAFLSKYICVMTLYAVIVTADLMSTQLSLRWMHRCAVGCYRCIHLHTCHTLGQACNTPTTHCHWLEVLKLP